MNSNEKKYLKYSLVGLGLAFFYYLYRNGFFTVKTEVTKISSSRPKKSSKTEEELYNNAMNQLKGTSGVNYMDSYTRQQIEKSKKYNYYYSMDAK